MPLHRHVDRRLALRLGTALGLSGLLAGHSPARAQSARATLVVAVPAGGGMDATARLIAEHIREAMGGTVVVENKPGAALRLALYAVRDARPDGTTMLYTAVSPFTIYPHVYRKLGYDPDTQLVPVVPAVSFDYALGVPGSSGIQTLAQYLDAARQNPDRNGLYAVPAAGAGPHFVGEALAKAAGVKLTHVPYKGSAPAMQDLLGGQVPACCNVLGEFLSYRASGRVRILATTGAARSPLTPDVPTFAELGYRSITFNEQFGLFAPAGTPEAVVARWNAAVLAAVQRPEVRQRLAELGYTPLALGSGEFAAKLRNDRSAWAPVVKATGFTVEE